MQVNYYLNTKYIGNAFYVPNAIVDDYIHSANGNAIKILLIILRNTKVIPSFTSSLKFISSISFILFTIKTY